LAAAELAVSLKASKLIMLTNVKGVLNANKQLVKTLTLDQAKKLVDSEAVSGGMTPKLKSCILALEGGVPRSHIIKASRHALLEEVLTKDGTGTMINGN